MQKQKIKIALILDSFQMDDWKYIALERVIQSPNTNIDTIIFNGVADVKSQNHSNIIYWLFDKLDRFLFKRALGYSKQRSIKPLLDKITQLSLDDYILAGDQNPDILINMGSIEPKDEILDIAKYGVWSYQIGEPSFNRGGPAGFWEAIKNRPVTGATLNVLAGKNIKRQILYQSSVMTKNFKPTLNKPQIHYLAAGFLSRQIDLLFHIGDEQFYQHIKKYNKALNFFSYPSFQYPDNWQALLIFIQFIWRMAGRVLRRLFYFEHWYLFYDFKPQLSQTLHQFKKLMPEKSSFWADPMVLYEYGKYYIFFEELIYKTNRGHISLIEMDGQGNYSDAQVVLKKDYHLSYPFVFKHADKYYMLPETVENQNIELYESSKFPLQWEFKMNLMENVNAVDSTLFYYFNKWWLFTSMEDVKGSSFGVELFLFWSDELLSNNWTAHPLNPIVSGVETARSAGRIFIKDNKIYRPSQDCSVRYGHCTNINEITELSETAYNEHKVSSITPNWDKEVLGTHTLNHEKDMTIVDAYYYRSRFW